MEDNEDAEKTAKRELLEETGYFANKIEHVYMYHPSVSKSRQLVHVFRAKGLVKSKSKHDRTEDIRDIEILSASASSFPVVFLAPCHKQLIHHCPLISH
jgi:ADP-ribose pyrophosphatase